MPVNSDMRILAHISFNVYPNVKNRTDNVKIHTKVLYNRKMVMNIVMRKEVLINDIFRNRTLNFKRLL